MTRKRYLFWGGRKSILHFLLFHYWVDPNYFIEQRLQIEYAKHLGIDPNIKMLRYHSEDQLNLEQDTWVGPESWIWCHADQDSGAVNGEFKGCLTINTHTHIGSRFHADCYAPLFIGEDCLIADDVLILTANHGMNPEGGSYVNQPFEAAPVSIKDGVWIGSRVTLLPGVTVGERSILGANSVVTKDIPPYSIAVGIPARVIKQWSFNTHKWERVN